MSSHLTRHNFPPSFLLPPRALSKTYPVATGLHAGLIGIANGAFLHGIMNTGCVIAGLYIVVAAAAYEGEGVCGVRCGGIASI